MKVFLLNTVERRLVNKTKQAESKVLKILIGLTGCRYLFSLGGIWMSTVENMKNFSSKGKKRMVQLLEVYNVYV